MSLSLSTQNHSGGHMRSLAMALAGASVAAVGTMFVPVSLLEGLAGSTGLSELVPAARAPLGDTARALIAFGTGALTLAGLSILLLRQDSKVIRVAVDAAPQENGKGPALAMMLAGLRAKMPWNQADGDIRELADLPKLRNGDVHPDAPARRPLSAAQDLPTLELSQTEISPEVEPGPVHDAQLPVEAIDPLPAALPEPPPVAAVEATVVTVAAPRPATGQGSIAEMVSQLEAAVAQRQLKLAELEAVAAHIASERPLPFPDVTREPAAPVIPTLTAEIDTPIVRRPVLEAVPTAPRQDDEVDSALAAALATLQRMNAGGR